ncbi:MAG TPA: AraC family transcriptional regulator, partial [Negativicutes bacterium]|nr:AraC family transcriptional regulator [Negativicutes bacterium]
LGEIARQFSVSDFHFNRMFRTVTGRTLKQYILGRKLTIASERMLSTDESLIDIAYDFGFEYPEVFSRAFKKQFGVSPQSCRKEKVVIKPVGRAVVVERDIMNYQGSLALRGNIEYLEELRLEGIYAMVDADSEGFRSELTAIGEEFRVKCHDAGWLKKDRLYTTVSCHGEDNGKHTVFYGLEAERPGPDTPFDLRIVPEGWYAGFVYRGDMFDISEAFVDDLYRWIMVKEVQLNPNGIGMLDIFEKDYPATGIVKIFVPVKWSDSQQEMS